LIGVGPDNFGDYAAEYADPVGGSVDIVGGKAHNLYLGLLAETGLLGFTTFAAAIGSTLAGLWSIRRRYGAGGSEFADFANALILALFAYALTALFLHLSYQRYFWFLVALAGALIASVRESEQLADRSRSTYPWSPIQRPLAANPPQADL
jgi:putative inorganic carbon (HCO3(-)) transporter